MSVSAHDSSPGEARAQDNDERLYAIADTSSPGAEVFARHHTDDNLHRGTAYPISKVLDPGDAVAMEWHPGLTQAVIFHNPHSEHKVVQFCQQDDLLPQNMAAELLQQLKEQSNEGSEVGLGSVVLAHVNARNWSIAIVRLARSLPKGKAVKSATIKPFKVEFIGLKQKDTKKQVDMTKGHVILMTLSSPCRLSDRDLVETFPHLGEAQIKVREAKLQKAKVNGVIDAVSSTSKGVNVSVNTTDEANAVVSNELVATVSEGKKRATSPVAQHGSEQDSGALPAAKRVKTNGGIPVSAQPKEQSKEESSVTTDYRMAIDYLLNPERTESASGNIPNQQSSAAKVMPVSHDDSEKTSQDFAPDKRLKAGGGKKVSFALPDTSGAPSQAVVETSTDGLPDTPDTRSAANHHAGQNVIIAQAPATAAAPRPRPVPGSLYFDQTYGCQFIEPYFRLPVIGMITELRDCTSSIAQFQQTFPTEAQAAEEINRYKRTYVYVVREGNAEKTKQAVPPPRTKSRDRFWWTSSVNNFKWDCEAFDTVTAAFEKYLNEVVAIHCELYDKKFEEEKV